MRLFSLVMLMGLALGLSGCQEEKKKPTITPPPPGSSLGTGTQTSAKGS
ncbi:MAG: hypothetical protein N2112_10975 [Gemmataceae bacterium]|jgi:hypothetical protein|nr:hypothetical protein [Gemmataceae bacterium]